MFTLIMFNKILRLNKIEGGFMLISAAHLFALHGIEKEKAEVLLGLPHRKQY